MKSAEDLYREWDIRDWGESWEYLCEPWPDKWRELIAARDAEVRADTVQRCADAYERWLFAGGGTVDQGMDAIRAVATPPESPRERLGKVVREAFRGGVDSAWASVVGDIKETYMEVAEAVLEEKARIDAEGKG